MGMIKTTCTSAYTFLTICFDSHDVKRRELGDQLDGPGATTRRFGSTTSMQLPSSCFQCQIENRSFESATKSMEAHDGTAKVQPMRAPRRRHWLITERRE